MQKITRVCRGHDLAEKAAHEVKARGGPAADIRLLAVEVTSSQGAGATGIEATGSGRGTIVAGPEARAAGTPEESADTRNRPEHGDARLLTVQGEEDDGITGASASVAVSSAADCAIR